MFLHDGAQQIDGDENQREGQGEPVRALESCFQQPENGDEEQHGEAAVQAHPQDTQDHRGLRRGCRGGPCRRGADLVVHAFSVVPCGADFGRNAGRMTRINLLVDRRVNHSGRQSQLRG